MSTISASASNSPHLATRAADPARFLLNDLDLDALARRLRHLYPSLDVDLLVTEYRRFLVLKCAYRDEDAKLLSPSPMIDQVWHAHILDTRSYIGMCSAVGMWIHHDPDGANETHAAHRARRRANTCDLYLARFGPMDQDVWDMEGVRRPYLPGQDPRGLVRQRDEPADKASQDKEDAPSASKKQRHSNSFVLRFRDLFGSDIEFRVSKSTVFDKLASAYAELKGLCVDDVRFVFCGRRLAPDNGFTVEELDFVDGDVIHICMSQSGC